VSRRFFPLLAAAIACAAMIGLPASAAAAEERSATWASEQPRPPVAPPGQPQATVPVGLGTVGDVEFFAPNRGLLITSGNGSTVPAGVWSYNGVEWHEVSTECGAALVPNSQGREGEEGRIAWAGPSEFWTVSTGRAGQRSESNEHNLPPPLIDNTLCHFAGGSIVGSYAHLAFSADSYLDMHAAGCLGPADCWFGGEALEEPQTGGFQLHWNGSSLETEPYPGEGHAIESMVELGGALYEGVRVKPQDRSTTGNGAEPPVVHRVNPAGVEPTFEAEPEVPLYGHEERPTAIDYLHLSSSDGTLWGAAGRKRESAEERSEPGNELGQATIVRRVSGSWTQIFGPAHPLPALFPGEQEREARLLGSGEHLATSIAANADVASIAAEPGGESAWIALRKPGPTSATEPARAVVVHVSAEGQVLQTVVLPSAAEEASTHIGAKGGASFVTCPAAHDCWLATTQGWLFHLAGEGERTLARDEAEGEYFCPERNYPQCIITFRPRDQGLPQEPPDAPPPDVSGLNEAFTRETGRLEEQKATPAETNRVTLPLLSHVHSRLLHGRTLELSFHLSVRARMRLVARRKHALVAQTPMQTFKPGNRRLMLTLNPRRWPTKLALQAHALEPLRIVSSVTGEGANVTTQTTGLFVSPQTPGALWGQLP
jgi:hypothetical protein